MLNNIGSVDVTDDETIADPSLITLYKSYYNEINFIIKTVFPQLRDVSNKDSEFYIKCVAENSNETNLVNIKKLQNLSLAMLKTKMDIILSKLQETREINIRYLIRQIDIQDKVADVIDRLNQKITSQESGSIHNEVYKLLAGIKQEYKEEYSSGEVAPPPPPLDVESDDEGEEPREEIPQPTPKPDSPLPQNGGSKETEQELVYMLTLLFKNGFTDETIEDNSKLKTHLSNYLSLILIGMDNTPFGGRNQLKKVFLKLNETRNIDSSSSETSFNPYNLDIWNVAEHDRRMAFDYTLNEYIKQRTELHTQKIDKQFSSYFKEYPYDKMLKSFGNIMLILSYFKK